MNTPIYQSFDREEWRSFFHANLQSIQINWDDAFNQLFDEIDGHTTNRTSVGQSELEVPLPKKSVSNHPNSLKTHSTGDFESREMILPSTLLPPVVEMTEKVFVVPTIFPIPDNPASIMDQIHCKEIIKGNNQFDESSEVKRNFISS